MPIPIAQWQMPTFQQANPWLQGVQAFQGLQQQAIQNRYLAPMLQARLTQMGLQAQQTPVQTQLMREQVEAYPKLTQAQINRMNAENLMDEFKRQNPLLFQSGMAGQLGSYIYLQNHPELAGKTPEQQQGVTPHQIAPTMSPGSSPTVNPIDYQQARTNQDLLRTGAIPTPLSLQPGMEGSSTGLTPQLSSTGNPLLDQLRGGMFAQQNMQQARAGYYNKMVQSFNWRSLPVDQKTALLAQAAGMGYDNITATQLLMNGNTIADLARAKGLDPNNLPPPNYALTKGDITRLHQTQAAQNELQVLNPKIYNALAPYSARFHGYSPKQVGEAIKGENPDAQAKFFAAKALVPEMTMIRTRLANPATRAGVELVREITNSSMSNIKAFQPFVTPQIYSQANKYIDQWLTDAVTARNSALLTAGKAGAQTTIQPGGVATGAPTTLPTGRISVISPTGARGTIPAAQLDDALKQGYKRAG